MTTPPSGETPAADNTPPAGQESAPTPPAPQGPPPGYPPQPPAGQGYPPQGPPPGYPPQPPAGQGYPQQGPPPGYPPQPPAGQGYPPQPPAGQGYPPQPPAGQGYPPQGPPAQGQPATGGSSFDISKVAISDWVLMGAGLLYVIFSFLRWGWKIGTRTVFGVPVSAYPVPYTGWNSWWVIASILILAVTVIKVLQVFVPTLDLSVVKAEYSAYAAVVAAALLLIALIVVLASFDAMSAGIWLSFIVALAFGYFAILDAQKKGANLPVKLPAPPNF